MRVQVRGLTLVLCALAGACLASSAGSAGAAHELPESFVFETGKLGPLQARVAYQAHDFPIALRVTAPDGSWGGAQFKTPQPEHGHDFGPPYYGWATVGKASASTSAPPRALILIMTGYALTPSVAATVSGLRTRGHGATYEPTTPVKLAGFSGLQFGGEVVAPSHVFVPFSPRTNTAKGFPDAIDVAGPGHAFRITVLNVRGKTVVILVGSYVYSVEEFNGFLPEADAVLRSLRFPR